MKKRLLVYLAGLCVVSALLGGCGGSNAEYIFDDHFDIPEEPQLSADPAEDPYSYLKEYLASGKSRTFSDNKKSVKISTDKEKNSAITVIYTDESPAFTNTITLTLEEGKDRLPFLHERETSLPFGEYPDVEGYLESASGEIVITDWNMTDEDWEESFKNYLEYNKTYDNMFGEDSGTGNTGEEETAFIDEASTETEEEQEMSLEDYKDQCAKEIREHVLSALRMADSWLSFNNLQLTLNELGVSFFSSERLSAAEIYNNTLRLEEIDALPDEAGKELRLAGVIEIKDGQISLVRSRYLYNDRNQLIRRDSITSDWGHSYLLFSYDDSGNCVKKESWDTGKSEPTDETVYEYDEKGRVIREESTLYGTLTYTYTEHPEDQTTEVLKHCVWTAGVEEDIKEIKDSEGRVLEEYYEDENGRLYLKYSHEYDEHGNETLEVTYEEDGTEKSVDRYRYEYDDEGRVLTKVKISNEDEEERTLEEWTYDSYGNGYVDALFSEYYDRFGHILYGDELYYCYEQPE